MKTFARRLYYSFPVQLVFLHLRSNLMLLFLWVLLVLIITGVLGRRMGMLFLFLDPEYLGKVSFLSFFWIGLCFSGFLMTWNMAIYITNSHRFPFLASLKRPFVKFCLNNSIIPGLFLVYYITHVSLFQWNNELTPEYGIFFDVAGFLSGLILGITIALIYFSITNKDVHFFNNPQRKEKSIFRRFYRQMAEMDRPVKDPFRETWRVEYYLTETFKIRRTRNVDHYDFMILDKVFKQNHANALVIHIVGITLMNLLGLFMESSVLRIPAAASMLILMVVMMTILGALTYWLREWRAAFLVGLVVLINTLTVFGVFDFENRVYGLNYEKPVRYSNGAIDTISSRENFDKDKRQTIAILNRWRSHFPPDSISKPKMVFVCASGGGIRAASWAVNVMQQVDSTLKGRLMPHTTLMSGASGGMLGLGYYRELYLRSRTDKKVKPNDKKNFYNIAKDIVNPVCFSIIVNDLFMPWIKFKYKNKEYTKDRGYIFEQQLNENCEGILDKTLGDYEEDERSARIPMMMLTPVIVNDGRQLVISPVGVSYMDQPEIAVDRPGIVETDAIDCGRFFKNNDAGDMRFLSALRMNATYPYILPNVYLPTEPKMQVMDAGFRDNFGLKTATRFVHVFKEWIAEHTSGVVFIQIRGDQKYPEIKPHKKQTMVGKVFDPLGTVGIFTDLQDYEHDEYISYLEDLLGKNKVDVVRFIYEPSKIAQRASMSLHLTTREKIDIYYAFYLKHNQDALKKLKKLIR